MTDFIKAVFSTYVGTDIRYSLRYIALLIASLIVISASAMAQNGVDLGQKVPDFKLNDLNGKTHSLSQLQGKNGTLLMFISVQCPVSNDYNERMNKIASDYRSRGINFIGINSNSTEAVADIKSHAAKQSFSFTILKDVDNKIADMLNAQVTPEAYLLNTEHNLIYHGRIDNARKIDQIKSPDLNIAIDSLLAGKPIATPRAKAFGCSIKRASKS